jgi:peptide/nickel transport system ATP-binding protein
VTTALSLRDLTIEFSTPAGVLRAVDGVDLDVEPGEALAIVGESGSGKSVLARSLVGLLAPNGHRRGTVVIGGRDVDALTTPERRHFFGVEVAMIFQDPMTSLNPVKRIGAQLTEGMRHHLGLSRRDANERAVTLLDQVHIPSARQRLRQYPHELSGGMRQRVVIAMALACEPELLIADEPTTALDVTVQRTILDLLDELRRERNMAMVLITHDLGVARGRTDRVAVMYAGRVRETGDARAIFDDVAHPYTQALLGAIPSTRRPSHTRLVPIPGRPPDLVHPPTGCAFAPRCRQAGASCLETRPPLVELHPGHWHACLLPVGTDAGTAALAANLAAGVTPAGLPLDGIGPGSMLAPERGAR